MHYNHHDYIAGLSGSMVTVNHHLRATIEEDPEEINDQLSNLSGFVVISVDGGQTQSYSDENGVLVCANVYQLVVLQQTSASDSQTVIEALCRCRQLAYQFVCRIIQDANNWENGLEGLDIGSMGSQGIGPIGGTFHGIVVEYVVNERIPLESGENSIGL